MQKMIIRISAVVSLFLLILGSPRCFAQSEAGFIESAGVRLRFYDSGGDRETVILLTLGGDNSGGRASRLIKAGFRVVTLHMRGFGDSEKPSGAAMYGLEMSNDVLRLVKHLGLPRVHLIGSSIGARIANRFRAAHPNRLLSVTMLQGGVMTKSSAYLSRASEFADALDRGDWGPFILGTTARARKAPTREEIEALNEKQKSSGATRVWAAVIRGQGFEDSLEELRHNTVPVLAVVGDLDPIKEWEIDPMVDVMPKLEVVVIPNKAHGELGTNETLMSSLVSFLKRNSSSSRSP